MSARICIEYLYIIISESSDSEKGKKRRFIAGEREAVSLSLFSNFQILNIVAGALVALFFWGGERDLRIIALALCVQPVSEASFYSCENFKNRRIKGD